MYEKMLAVMAVLLIAILAVGCATPSQSSQKSVPPPAPAATVIPPTVAAQPATARPASAATGSVALKISGKVGKESAWTEEQVRAMPVMQAKGTNQQGASETYTGVALNDLLKQAGVQSDAVTLVFTGEGGQTAEAAWSAVQSCAECILSFRSRGGFSLVLPGFPAAVQLKGVTAITVK